MSYSDPHKSMVTVTLVFGVTSVCAAEPPRLKAFWLFVANCWALFFSASSPFALNLSIAGFI